MSSMTERHGDVDRARTLSIVSVVWGAGAALLGTVLGVTTGSLAVIGFAIDSAIDSAASVALVWRFGIERQEPERANHVEHLAERAVGAVLMAAALSLTIGAIRALLAHDVVTPSILQVAFLVLSLLVLPPLALAKRRVALRLGSTALRNDSLLTAAGALLAGVALLAVVLASAGMWWADPIGSLVVAATLAREGWGSVRAAGPGKAPGPGEAAGPGEAPAD